MATLTTEEKRLIRNLMEKKAIEAGFDHRWIKECMHDTAQAVEDALQSIKSQVSSDMDTASTAYGVSFTGAEKKKIAALVMQAQYVREWLGVS